MLIHSVRTPSLHAPKALHLTIAARTKAADGQPSCTITTGDPDRTGDVIEPSGVNLTNYLKNPVVMFSHDYQEIPVGVCTSITTTPKGLEATWRWLENDPFADRVANAWNQDALRACSVGILPLKWQYDEERRGYDFIESDLLEFSICPIPMNPAATRVLRDLGLDRTSAATAQLSDEMAGLKAQIADLTVSVQALTKASVPAANDDEKCAHCKGAGLEPESAMGDPKGQQTCAVCGGDGKRKSVNDEFVLELADDDPDAITFDEAEFKDLLQAATVQALQTTIAEATKAAMAKALGRID